MTPTSARAAEIHATLLAMRTAHLGGQPRTQVETEALARLSAAGFDPDYAAIRRCVDLDTPADTEHGGLIALIAARLGATRLIDNLPFDGG